MELSQRHRTKVSISDFITKVRTIIYMRIKILMLNPLQINLITFGSSSGIVTVLKLIFKYKIDFFTVRFGNYNEKPVNPVKTV